MGAGDCKGGLQTGISKETTFSRHKTYYGQFRKFKSYKFRNNRFINKTSDRTSPGMRFPDWILQYNFSSTKEKRGNASRHKFKASKQISAQTAFQNGYASEGPKLSQKRRLGNNIRPEGCILTRADLSQTQKISSFLYTRPSLPVSSSMFRADISPTGIYKNRVSGGSTPKVSCHSPGNIFRRLACDKSEKTSFDTRSGHDYQSPSSTGFYNQQREVVITPVPDGNLYRSPVQIRAGNGLPNSRAIGEAETGHIQSVSGQHQSQELPFGIGNHSILYRANSKCETVYAPNSASSIAIMEPVQNEFGSSSGIICGPKIPPPVVVASSEHSKGSLVATTMWTGDSDHRCLKHRLGRALQFPHSAGVLVRHNENATHKLSGNGGSTAYTQTFSPIFGKQNSSDPLRQHHSGPIHQQTGGNTFSSVMRPVLESVDVGSTKQYNSKSSSYSRSKECSSGLSEQIQNCGDRVVSEHDGGPTDFQSVGPSCLGSVCDIRQPKDTSVLFMDVPSASTGNRCTINKLGENVCVCVSASVSNSQGINTHATLSMSSHFDSSMLAATALVPAITPPVDSSTSQVTVLAGPSQSAEGAGSACTTRNSRPDCMVAIDKRLQAEGFSANARNLLSASWRSGTQRDYRCKFRQFSSWCLERQINPYGASLSQCANFLTYLFDKGLKYRTIAGYRSMLSVVLPPIDKIPIGQHPYVIRLLRGVFNTRPPMYKLLPEWDLLLVLEQLKTAPFEPMKDARLKFVTWKTVFLVAITTFRRCSDLRALQLGEGAVNVQRTGLTFVRQGLSKQDRANHHKSTIFVPALPGNKLLDPKRAVGHYLRRTEAFRHVGDVDETKLFLSYVKPHKPVSSQTISKWIVNTIKFAYKSHNKSVSNVKAHSTRAVGPSWAIYRGATVNNVMNSADWSKETTFTKHYLKSVYVDFLQT